MSSIDDIADRLIHRPTGVVDITDEGVQRVDDLPPKELLRIISLMDRELRELRQWAQSTIANLAKALAHETY